MHEKIYSKTLKLFHIKGVRFTTEELATELGTSKRTLYSYFTTKDEILEKTIDFVFLQLMESDEAILANEETPLQEKLQLYFKNIPAINIGSIIRQMDDLQRYYPDLWEKVNVYLDTIWDKAIQLVADGITDGKLRSVDITVLKIMLSQTIKKLLDYDFLAKSQISFDSGLIAMSDIVLNGLLRS